VLGHLYGPEDGQNFDGVIHGAQLYNTLADHNRFKIGHAAAAPCDHWFCDVPSQTFMSRSFWTAASSSGLVVNSRSET
jgi:hypothetical protein